MTPNERADLIFDIADVLNDYEDAGCDVDEIRREALGIVKGWNDE